MWQIIKTIVLGLLDFVVLFFLIRLLFQTPAKFLKALWRAGQPTGFTFLRLRNRDGETDKTLEVSATIIVLCLLIWVENKLFF